MSNSVDTKVVEMQFNNQNFEKNVATSLGTLDKLKSALNFKNSAQQLTNLQTATNNVDFSPFTNALDAVQNRFSMLGIVGATVISNLTTTLMGKVKNLLTAIPNQISQGGLSRALNIEQAKFQLKGLGVAWADIEDDINYGVKDTAYGLDAAAKAASQLKASGVELGDEMKEALRGISGVAAMTNSSYEEISPIFTTIAGQGKVMTMQLRQLESRGLNVAAKLGEAMGKTESEIRDMVTKGEIDFKTFSHYMNEAFGEHAKKANETYTGALGNVKAALSRIGAEFKAARLENLRQIFVAAIPVINSIKKQMAGLTNIIVGMSTAVKDKLVKAFQFFDPEHGTLGPLMTGELFRMFEKLAGVVSQIGGAFSKAFSFIFLNGANFTKWEKNIIPAFSKFVDSIQISEDTIEVFRQQLVCVFRTIRSLLLVVESIGGAVVTVGRALGKILYPILEAVYYLAIDLIGGLSGPLTSLAEEISYRVDLISGTLDEFVTNVTYHINDFIYKVKDYVEAFDGPIRTFFRNVKFIVSLFKAIVSEGSLTFDIIKEFSEQGFDVISILKKITGQSEERIKVLTALKEATLSRLFDDTVIGSLFKVRELLSNIGSSIKNVIDNASLVLSLFKEIVFKGGISYSTIRKFEEEGYNIAALLSKLTGLSIERIKVLASLGEASFSRLFENTIIGNLLKTENIFNRVSTGVKTFFSFIGSVIGDALSSLFEGLAKPFQEGKVNPILGFFTLLESAITALMSLRIADVLGNASEEIRKFTGIADAIRAPFLSLNTTLKVYQNTLKADILKKIGEALLMIAGAMLILSMIDKDKLMGATVAMTEMMYALVGAFSFMEKNITMGKGVKGGINAKLVGSALMNLSVAILIMSAAVKNLGNMDDAALAKGLASVSALLAIFSGFFKILNSKTIGTTAPRIASIAKSLVIFGVALNLLVRPVEKLGGMELSSLEKGVGSIASMLLIFAGFFKLLNSKIIGTTSERISSLAGSLVVLAIALNLMIIPIKVLGELDVKTLEKGVGSIGALLGVFAIFFKLLSSDIISTTAPRINSIAKSLILFGIALNMLMIPVKVLGGLDLVSLGKGLGSIAILLGSLVAAMVVLSKTKVNGKEMLKLAAALLIIANALVILSGVIRILGGMEISELVTGLVGLGAALTIVVLAGMGAQAVATGLLALGGAIALIGVGVAGIGAGLFLFATGLGLLVSLGAAGLDLLAVALVNIINLIPLFLAELGYGIVALLDALSSGYDSFVRFGATLIVATCDGFIQSLPKIMELIGVLFDTLEALFFDYGPRLIDMGINMILMLADGIINGMPAIVDKAFVIIITFIDSMSAALDEHGDEFWQAVDNFILSVLDFLGLKVKDWAQAAKDWLAGLKQGFEEKAEEIKENIKAFVREKIIEPLKGFWEDLKGVGAYLIDGLIQGILNTPILGTIAKLGGRIIGAFNGSLQINSPSKLTEMTGEYFIEGFVKGINENKYKAVHAVDGVVKALDINGKRLTIFDDPIRAIKLDAKKFVEKSVEAINWGEKTIRTYIDKFGQTLFDAKLTFDPGSEIDFATKSIAKLSKTLYLNSQEYRESNEKVQEYINSIKQQEDYIKALDKEIAKQQKAANNGSEEAQRNLDALNNELEMAKDNLKDMGSDLSAELTAMANGAKNAFDTLRTGISDNVKNSVDILKVSVNSYVDLFTKFQEVENIPVERILKSMRSQIVGVSKWRDDLAELGKRGIADGLLDQLRNMGVDGEKYIQAFLKMTDEELNQANLMFRAKNELTSQTLIDGMKDQFKAIEKWTSNIELLAQKGINFDLLMDLQEAGPDNAEYVQALADMTAAQIDEVNELYKKSKTLPTSIADRVLSSLALSNEGRGNLVGEDMASALAEVLASDDIGEKFTEALAVGIKNSETSVVEASKVVGESSLVEFNKYFSTENGSYIAVNMVNGLANGLITGQSIIADASRELARAAYDSTTDELGIHSPSKAFEEIGKFSDMGLANGLLKYSSIVNDATTSIGDSALTTMKESMDKISALLNNEVNNPVITPTLDLSDISNNAGRINKMFDNPTLGTNLEELPGIQNGKIYNFTQNNYSPKALSRIEIYRQSKNLFSTLKGTV